MEEAKKITSALISVYDKTGLEPIVRKLSKLGVTIYSTGGTKDFIDKLGVNCTAVEHITSFPEVLGGRVKTLHPKIFGGILARRDNKNDLAEMARFEIPSIDLVMVDLYPFEATVASGASEAEVIEKIDIGGISLIRAGAKNFEDVVIIPSKKEYPILQNILDKQNNTTFRSQRKELAAAAFQVSSSYDNAIQEYLAGNVVTLRYGENPHQKGMFRGNLDAMFTKLNGKELSYNNLLDLDAAMMLLKEFSEPTFLILKHNNPCGAASGETVLQAWQSALASDALSAFGGVLVCNREIDLETAKEIDAIFLEVLAAPSFSNGVIEMLSQKKNRIILQTKAFQLSGMISRTVLNGILDQDRDSRTATASELKTVTKLAPDKSQLQDLLFAEKIVKHAKSNAIVLARNKRLLGIGAGLTSRVDALKHAIEKSKEAKLDLTGASMASDAFFPFADSVEIAHKAGISSVIQPGGSVKDKNTIDYCDANGMTMVFTGIRHFKH